MDIKTYLPETIHRFYPQFPHTVVKDFTQILLGNLGHVSKRLREIEKGERPVEVNHQEQVLCLGTGFDWLHLPNFALIVNPVALDPKTPFVTQLKVIFDNWEQKRIPHEKGMSLMISTSYKNPKDRRHSKLKAISLLDFAQDILEQSHPHLIEAGLQIIVGIMDESTRLFEPLDEKVLKTFSKSSYSIPTKLNPINEFLIAHNKAQSDEFTSPYNINQRARYRQDHPTEIMALKCMDGRIHLPIATETPMGIIQPMRNVGAKFNFGWKAFYDRVSSWVDEANIQDKNCLILATYHFSKFNQHFGCAGHGYSTGAAKTNADELSAQARFVLGEGKDSQVSSAVIGFNTDTDSIVLHGSSPEQVLDIEELAKTYKEDITRWQQTSL